MKIHIEPYTPEACNVCRYEVFSDRLDWLVCGYGPDAREIPNSDERPEWCQRDADAQREISEVAAPS